MYPWGYCEWSVTFKTVQESHQNKPKSSGAAPRKRNWISIISRENEDSDQWKPKKKKNNNKKLKLKLDFYYMDSDQWKPKKKTTITTNWDLHYKVQKSKQTTNKRKQNKQTNKCYLCPIRFEKKLLSTSCRAKTIYWGI